MGHTVPLFVPLVEGLDLSKDSTLTGKELQIAENVDWSVQGQVRGRPSRAQPVNFVVQDPAGTPLAAPSYLAATAFANTGFVANGLMRLRDGTGERAMLGTYGRLFTKESANWKDRGGFGCMKVDRPHSFLSQPSGSLVRQLTGPNFGSDLSGQTTTVALLDTSTYSFDRYVNLSATPEDFGGSAKAGTVAAALYRTSANALRMVLRSDGASTISDVSLATDAAGWNDDGDMAVVCSNQDGTLFFVVYQTTTANQYKVLKVSTAGSVTATFTGTLSGIWGHWVSASSVADNKVVVGLTNSSGLTLKVLNATTMADNSVDSTYGSASWDGREVVVGVDSATRVWWAFRANATAPGMYVGVANPGTASSATLGRSYLTNTNITVTYTPLHQPVRLSGRTYFTFGEVDDFGGSNVGTWYTLDLSNLKVGSLTTVGPLNRPTLVARGRLDGLAMPDSTYQPECATAITNGWTFPTTDWVSYDVAATTATTGHLAQVVLNRVTLSKPRSVLAGNATLFSGSVPRVLAGDECYELGHPGGQPAMGVDDTGGGSVSNTTGDYGIYSCWVYTDNAGQEHRSAVEAQIGTLGAATDYFNVYVQNPYFTERPATDVRIEVYATEANPDTADQAFLQASVVPDFSDGATLVELFKTAVVQTTTRALYTLDGEFSHLTPNADGGIAALGRRVWLADDNTIYASLLLVPGQGPAWNGEGSLSVRLPSGAGRVVALEGLDDKLIVFCERGVYAIQDGGPDNTGLGGDIAFPIRLTDLGCAGPRSTCVTDRGVVFSSPLDTTDPQRGGPWLLDRSLSLTERQYLGSPAMTFFLGNGSWVSELCFSPERQQLYVSVPLADGTYTGVVVIDMRNSKWATWAHQSSQGALDTMDVVSGVLWTKGTEVAPFSGTPGSDYEGAYAMRIKTGHLAADGQTALGWSRVQGVSVLPGEGSTAHTLTMTAIQDFDRTSTSGGISISSSSPATAWPSNRPENEWRLPMPKCSTIQVQLSASPATARWAAIRLDVRPLHPRSPSKNRS